jgi:D-xylose transport system permease protein
MSTDRDSDRDSKHRSNNEVTFSDAVIREAASDFSLDSEQRNLSMSVSQYVSKLRSGDLGAWPALLAITVLCLIFGLSRSSTFVTITNVGNLLQQAAPIIVIAMAVSFVLLLGEIDLSAGFSAGVAAAVLAVRLQSSWNLGFSILAAAAVALVLGLFTGLLVARVGIPSFVVTLANFLSFQGILLELVKDGGNVRIENPAISAIENKNLSVGLSWAFGIIVAVVFALSVLRKQRSSAGTIPLSLALVKIGLVTAGALTFTAILSQNRALPAARAIGIKLEGVPYAVPLVMILVIVVTFVLTRTRYGRHLYAVGGNQEAARRAGINVARIRTSAFAICGLLAGVGGAFLASRLNSVDSNTGGSQTLLLAVGAAVIGGTSLFGGKGRMLNAVLGGLVLALIPNGLGLVGKAKVFGVWRVDFSTSGVNFIVSGLVLLVAASVDAISRKRTVS